MKRKYIYGFIILFFCIIAICMISISFENRNCEEIVYAEIEEQTTEEQEYELKIKLFDEYYWVSSDDSLSSTAVSLSVGADFNIVTFTEYVSSGQWCPEGQYIDGFVYENTETQCFFANNKILALGEEEVYTIEPSYEKESYTIYFNSELAIGTPIPMQTYKIGEVFELPEIQEFPQKESSDGTEYDYIFKGWYIDDELFAADEGVVIPDMSPNESVSNKTVILTAKWIDPFYNVIFHMSSEEEDIISAEVFYNQTLGEKFPSIVDNGYAFLGFAFNDGGIPEVLDGDYTWLKETDADLYCIRSQTPTQYTISYNSNGGTITNATSVYDVTQLPLKLTYDSYREFDYLNGFTLNNVYLGTENKDELPVGTVGNITLKAQWKAYRTSSSSSIFKLSESFSNEYTIVDCTNISILVSRTIIIESTVKEITFIGDFTDNVKSKFIEVESRDMPLTINLKNINWEGQRNKSVIDAWYCEYLTLNCVGQNKLVANDMTIEQERPGVIVGRDITVKGDSLIVEGANATNLLGGHGIFACGDTYPTSYFPQAVTININIDYLYAEGGSGTDGGVAIFCWGDIIIDNHQGQEVCLIPKNSDFGAVFGSLTGDYSTTP